MSKTKLTDLVRHEGEITTIAELDKRGLITYRKVDNFYKRKGAVYFADIKGTMDGWEIGKMAYLSRTGQTMAAKKNPKSTQGALPSATQDAPDYDAWWQKWCEKEDRARGSIKGVRVEHGASGVSVYAPYNKQFVKEIKTIPGRRWDPHKKCWTIPPAFLAELHIMIRDWYK